MLLGRLGLGLQSELLIISHASLYGQDIVHLWPKSNLLVICNYHPKLFNFRYRTRLCNKPCQVKFNAKACQPWHGPNNYTRQLHLFSMRHTIRVWESLWSGTRLDIKLWFMPVFISAYASSLSTGLNPDRSPRTPPLLLTFVAVPSVSQAVLMQFCFLSFSAVGTL